jgi:hypothetical protein
MCVCVCVYIYVCVCQRVGVRVYAVGSALHLTVVDDVVLDVVREALARVDPLLQLGVRNVTRDNQLPCCADVRTNRRGV